MACKGLEQSKYPTRQSSRDLLLQRLRPRLVPTKRRYTPRTPIPYLVSGKITLAPVQLGPEGEDTRITRKLSELSVISFGANTGRTIEKACRSTRRSRSARLPKAWIREGAGSSQSRPPQVPPPTTTLFKPPSLQTLASSKPRTAATLRGRADVQE